MFGKFMKVRNTVKDYLSVYGNSPATREEITSRVKSIAGSGASDDIIAMAVIIVLGIVIFTVSVGIITAQTTTSWGVTNVTIAYILPTIYLIGVLLLIVKQFRGTGHK